jgi:hypothetical protein
VPIVLPSASSWFGLDSISQVERSGLPEFCSGHYQQRCSMSRYREIRNLLVEKYRCGGCCCCGGGWCGCLGVWVC